MQKSLCLFAILGGLAVAIGAFGAHGLEKLVSAEALDTFETGVRYQFYHAFALGITGLLFLVPGIDEKWLGYARMAFLAGVLLFSVSLYLLTLQDYHPIPTAVLGPVTPLGGLAFIGGWVGLLVATRKIAGNPT